MSGPRYSVIPGAAPTDPHIKPRDLQLLCVLGRHTDDGGWCRRSQVKMAKEMGCARSTVFGAIERLVQRGYVERHLVESDSGRDSAHLYRVVLDPVLTDFSTVQDDETVEEGADDACETSSELPCRYTGTPADIPAPPAGPEPAPPAGPGPAPSITSPLNDPSLTEREGAGETEKAKEAKPVSRETWKRRLRKAHAAWPAFLGDSEKTAEIEWFRLSEEDRLRASELLDAFVLGVRKSGRTNFCAFSTYLSEKRWERLSESERKIGDTAKLAAPFGKAWGAARFACLMLEPTGSPPKFTTAENRLIAAGRYSREHFLREKRAREGWPRVNTMHDRAIHGHQGVACDPALAGLTDLFGQVHRGSPAWIAWRDLHAKKGWPWFGPDRDCPEWVWMPAPPDAPETYSNPFAEVRAALARFEAEHAHITERQAAE